VSQWIPVATRHFGKVRYLVNMLGHNHVFHRYSYAIDATRGSQSMTGYKERQEQQYAKKYPSYVGVPVFS
jgi:hypothetical protein